MADRTAWGAALGVLVRLWLALLVLVVVVRVLGVERGPFLVLLVGALPLTLLPAYPMAAVFALRRAWLPAAVAVAVVLAHLALVAPAVSEAPRPAGGTPLRVVAANLYVLNETPADAGRVLRDLRPDLLVVSELDAGGLAALRASGALDRLPHELVVFDGRAETVGLFSALPLGDPVVRRIGGRALPRATVTFAGTRLRVLGHHPLPPVQGLEHLWRRALSDLRAEVAGSALPVVVAGDLNADRDHALLRAVLDEGLVDAHDARGRGLVRTWPSRLPLLHLDHVLVSRSIGVADVNEARLPGSDHRAVVADLRVGSR